MIPLGIIGAAGSSTLYHANAIVMTSGNLVASLAGGSALANDAKGVYGTYFQIDGGGTYRAMVAEDTVGMCTVEATNASLNGYIGVVGARAYSGIATLATSSDPTWHDILISWDLSTAKYQVALDGVVTNPSGSGSASTVPWSTAIGNLLFGNFDGRWNGSLAEQFFDIGTSPDLSDSAVMAKWRNAITGKPVSKGIDGSLLLGHAPKYYFNNVAASAGTNQGTNGNATINGTITNASTSPSD